jgi:hypothetical protein
MFQGPRTQSIAVIACLALCPAAAMAQVHRTWVDSPNNEVASVSGRARRTQRGCKSICRSRNQLADLSWRPFTQPLQAISCTVERKRPGIWLLPTLMFGPRPIALRSPRLPRSMDRPSSFTARFGASAPYLLKNVDLRSGGRIDTIAIGKRQLECCANPEEHSAL